MLLIQKSGRNTVLSGNRTFLGAFWKFYKKRTYLFEYNPDYDYSSNPAAILLVVDLQNNVKARNKKKFCQEHQAELELYESAVKFFKEKNVDGKIPSMKSLKAEKEKLTIHAA